MAAPSGVSASGKYLIIELGVSDAISGFNIRQGFFGEVVDIGSDVTASISIGDLIFVNGGVSFSDGSGTSWVTLHQNFVNFIYYNNYP